MSNEVLAIVTLNPEKVIAGGKAPVFFASDQAEQERVSTVLSEILLGMVHDLENGVYIIVRH